MFSSPLKGRTNSQCPRQFGDRAQSQDEDDGYSGGNGDGICDCEGHTDGSGDGIRDDDDDEYNDLDGEDGIDDDRTATTTTTGVGTSLVYLKRGLSAMRGGRQLSFQTISSPVDAL